MSSLLGVDNQPLRNRRPLVHYRGVNENVWNYFYGIYGGGPEIKRTSLDIYAPMVSDGKGEKCDDGDGIRDDKLAVDEGGDRNNKSSTGGGSSVLATSVGGGATFAEGEDEELMTMDVEGEE